MRLFLSLAFLTLSALGAAALETHSRLPRLGSTLEGRGEDRACMLDQHRNVLSCTPAGVPERHIAEHSPMDPIEREPSFVSIEKRDADTTCFNDQVDSGGKLNARPQLSPLSLKANPRFLPTALLLHSTVSTLATCLRRAYLTRISVKVYSSIVYVCNFNTGTSIKANYVYTSDSTINRACGSNIAGRDRLGSTCECYGRNDASHPSGRRPGVWTHGCQQVFLRWQLNGK